ncbi:hypothetical protein [Gulosibacter hominis]|uniref:hypothetical protein n=1 Tax=Gulosibacter hominis TaxID=2770504 RepID=UPI00191A365A|nr:hypothetical protein [Gulosibacter hominis]
MSKTTTPALDGLEPPTPDSSLLQALDKTIQALEADGLIDDRHAALCELARVMAAATEAGQLSGRASAAAMAARELRECLEALPKPESISEAEAFAALVEQLGG